MKPDIGILINGSAKKVRTGVITAEGLRGIDPARIMVEETKSIGEIEGAVRRIIKSGAGYIGILGGDGTIHVTLGVIIGMLEPAKIPPLLVLKGGTQDNISLSIGLKGKSRDILARFVQAARESKNIEITERDTMKIDDRYCFLFGTGLVTNFLKEAYRGTEKGLKQNIKAIARAISQAFYRPVNKEDYIFRGVPADVTVDGKPLHFNYITAFLAGTVEQIGMGFKPLPRANERKGTFHAIISGATAFEIVTRLRSVKNGTPIKHPRHCDVNASAIVINSREPFDYTMDGDLYICKDRLEVGMGPRIKFVRV